MKVEEWLGEHPGHTVTIPENWTSSQALKCMLENSDLRDLYVMSENQVIGHLSYERLAKLLLAEHSPTSTRRLIMERVSEGCVEELMERNFVYALSDEDLDDVFHRMLSHRVENLAVLDANKSLVGTINMREVLKSVL